MAKIAVLGHGVVGSGVVEVIMSNKKGINQRSGQDIEVKKILDLRDFGELTYHDKFTKCYDDILNDDEITVIVETMGGISPAFEFAQAALNKGKSVVTSNKELVAAKGAKLLKLAATNSVNFFFEASVGGGIPIIRPIHQCLAANEINEVVGILNGTTNFILTKMENENMDFDTALKLAQDLGYAERNPSADVDGHDTCRKICILASLAFGRNVNPDDVHTEGIAKITIADIEYADNLGTAIKLIARAKRCEGDKIECIVSPMLVPKKSQLAGISDVFNGIMVCGNATGEVVFYGKGAGKLPTASAVVADVIDALKLTTTSISLTWDECDENIVKCHKDVSSAFFVRLLAQDLVSARGAILREFGEVKFASRINQPLNEVAFVTGILCERDVLQKLTNFVEADMTICNTLRVLGGNECD